MPSTTLQVAQQHRLEAGTLPHDVDIVVGCNALRTLGALLIALGLVGIEQHETINWRDTRPPQISEAAHCQLNPRQRIASARSKPLDDEMNGKPCLAEQVLQEPCIADF